MAKNYFPDDDRTNRERMIAGDLYIADDPESARIAHKATGLLEQYRLQVIAGRYKDARQTLGGLLAKLGDDATVKPPMFVDYGANIHIGARTFINSNLTALDVATITIGEDCQIGPNVQLLTPTHPVEPEPRRNKLEAAKPIVIGNNVWLGGGVIVCPGVTIGDNSVIGAGAVVTRNIPTNVLAFGNPAQVIRTI